MQGAYPRSGGTSRRNRRPPRRLSSASKHPEHQLAVGRQQPARQLRRLRAARWLHRSPVMNLSRGVSDDRGELTIRRCRLALLAIVAAAFVVNLWRLGSPELLVYDEAYYVKSARYYADPDRGGLVQPELSHPQLGAQVTAASMSLLGDHPFAWRLPSALAGALSVLFVFVLARALRMRRAAALFAAALWGLDPARVAVSRLALLDSMLIALILLATIAAIHAARRVANRRANAWMWVCAAGFIGGAAAAIKWSGLVPLAVTAPALAVIAWRSRRTRRDGATRIALYGSIALVAGVAAYAMPYLPLLSDFSVSELVRLQNQMWAFHTDYDVGHNQASPVWTWALQLVTMPLRVRATGDSLTVQALVGNPVVWLIVLPAALWQLVVGTARRSPARLVIAAGVLLHYLPWALSSRMMFFYYWLPAVPFGCLAIARTIADLQEVWTRTLAYRATAGLAAAAFVLLLPAATGTTMPRRLYTPIAEAWPLQIREHPPGRFRRLPLKTHHVALRIKSRR